MSVHEFEDPPEVPALGEYVQEDNAVMLAGPLDADALDGSYTPPERPQGLDNPQAAARVGAESEDLDRRLHRERPDISPDDPPRNEPLDAAATNASGPVADGADSGYDQSLDSVEGGLNGSTAAAEEAAKEAALHDLGEAEGI